MRFQGALLLLLAALLGLPTEHGSLGHQTPAPTLRQTTIDALRAGDAAVAAPHDAKLCPICLAQTQPRKLVAHGIAVRRSGFDSSEGRLPAEPRPALRSLLGFPAAAPRAPPPAA